MPEFTYEAMTGKAKEVSGVIMADNKITAIHRLKDMGLYPTQVIPKKEKKNSTSSFLNSLNSLLSKSVSQKELVTFMRQFATLIDASLPILRSIRVLEKQNKNNGLEPILKAVGDAVESGTSLSNALKYHEKLFSPLFVNMVHAGEIGGVLDTVLLQMANYFEKTAKLKKKVVSAMVYPSFVLIVALIIVICLIILIIPKFSKMFIEMNLELPFMTQILIDLSDFLKVRWYMPVVMIALFVFFIKVVLINKSGRKFIHSLLYKLPILGILISKIAISRFTRTFGTLIESGVQILEALNITKSTVGNAVVEEAISMVHDNLKEGESMVLPLTQANIFPPMVISMVSVGEETGKMSSMLIKIAESYEDDVDTAINGITSLIEPVLIITLAGVVGFIVVAMFMPMISLISNLTQ